MIFNIYQPTITKPQAEAVFAEGWNDIEWADAFKRVRMAFDAEPGLEVAIRDLAAAGVYKHAMVIQADDLEDCFAVGNGMGDMDMLVWKGDRTSSTSVGDVVIQPERHVGWLCIGDGWQELFGETIDKILANAATHIPEKAA